MARLRCVAFLLVAMSMPLDAAAQISRFQGMWLGRPADSSALARTILVNDLRVRVRERCIGGGDSVCMYEGQATAYRALHPTASDTGATALVVRLRGMGWSQLIILTRSDTALEARIFTDVVGRRAASIVEHLTLLQAMMRSGQPPMPQFPWPPPPATVSLRLPDSLVAIPGRDSLGGVFDRLRTALARVEVGWWSVYAIGTNGFAVVTRMETIDAAGRPKPTPERWSGPNAQSPFRFAGIGEYLKALFTARPGFYRIIVFAVTDRPSQSAGAPISADSAATLLRGGSDQLPQTLRRVSLGPDGRCLALIYEFARPTESDSARLVLDATVSALQHLTLAGIWTEQQLRR